MTATASMPSPARSDATITLECNNRCRFCPRTTLRHIQVPSEELEARLVEIRGESSRVLLSGGEVTLLPDLPELIARCRTMGFEQVGVVTNGRRLADPSLARAVVEAGLTEACFTVYDLRGEVHDGLTSVEGSLAETLQGLDNLLALAREPRHSGLLVRINTLLCVDNADVMQPLLRELAGRGVRRFLVGDMLLSERYAEALPLDRVAEVARVLGSDPELAGVTIQLRGFPLCVVGDVPGIEVEPHDIDTAILDAQDQDDYFAEFYDNFAHADPCGRCVARGGCPGLQKRYLTHHGARLIEPLQKLPALPALGAAPVVTEEELEAARRELAEFPPWPESGRLEVIPTTACPFRCTYCAVKLGRQDTAPQVLDRAVDLLLTSARERLELQFFGGEPLLRRREVLRTMRRAAELARDRGKQLSFVITTSGLLLDGRVLEALRGFDVRVMFSLDGPKDVMRRFRPLAKSGADPTDVLERNLRELLASGVDYFVNMVVTPEDVDALLPRFEYIAGLGARTIQVCYSLQLGWTDEAQLRFCDALRRCATRTLDPEGPDVRLQNLGSAAEPTVLSNDLLLDVNGALFSDAALFGERVLPGLRPANRIGDIFELTTFDGLRRTREQNLVILRKVYPDEDSAPRRLVEQQLLFGRRIQQTLDELGAPEPTSTATGPQHAAARVVDRNPLQDRILRRSLPHQARVMMRRPELLRLPILMLENACRYDCLFCLAKPLPPTPLDGVERWLADNRRLGLPRLGIAGNEPLLHPHIDAILAAGRRYGFQTFDILTSGAPLADPARARALVDAGARAFAIPLYAADAAVHDAITQTPGSHADTVRAIDNLRGQGATIHVHANLVRQNLTHLAALEALVRDDWGLPLCVIPVRAKSANRPYAALMPRYDEIADRARVSCLLAFPLCVAERVQSPVLPSEELISDVLKLYVLDQPFTKPDKCRPCRWFRRCSGTFEAYLELHGDGELRPS